MNDTNPIILEQMEALQGLTSPNTSSSPAVNFLDFLKSHDMDGNGGLSADETNMDENKFNFLDQNQDQLIDLVELKTGFKVHKLKQQMEQLGTGIANFKSLMNGEFDTQLKQVSNMILQQKDTNGDNAINFDEAGVSEEIFKKLDQNSDAVLDEEEFANAFKNEVLKEQLGRLISGAEHLQDLVKKKEEPTQEEDDEDSTASSEQTEILYNGIDDDNDGEIDEDDSDSGLEDVISQLV